MRELSQIRDAVVSALAAEGMAALDAYPDQRARRYGCPVAAVAVETAESRTVGFCNYLGEVFDTEAGAPRELYGKQLEAVISIEIRGQRAADCEQGCETAAGKAPVPGVFPGPGGRGRHGIFGLSIEGSSDHLSETMHERPGVYSSYDASTVVSAGRAAKVIGVAAKAVKGTAGEVVTLTGYAAGVAAFGEDAADTPGMSTILRLLFANGASTVAAVRVAEAGAVKDYQDAFAALGGEEARILVCDSAEETVQQALRTAVEDASAARMERIAVVGGDSESAAELVTHAAALNSERMVLVGPDALDSGGKTLPGVFAAAALAGVIASGRDPGVPLNGAEIRGLGGLGTAYTDNDIDLLVRGGVTPLESTAGTVSPVRGITTRTTTGGAADTTWRELTTILIVDDVIPAVRQALRSKFARAKNTAQSRSAIRSQVIVELEKKVAEEIIDSYGEVTVTASEDDPTVCLVEFSFAVAHGLNQIYLMVHITV